MAPLVLCYLANWGEGWPIKRRLNFNLPSRFRIFCTRDLGAAMRSPWVAEILSCRVFSVAFVAPRRGGSLLLANV